MITKTRGIVIKYLKYQETSIIVSIFTEQFGLTSFIVNGIRSPRSKRSIGYFQPCSLLDMVVYVKPNREIQRLSEYKFLVSKPQIQQDIRKGTIILFLAEILSKLLKHEQGESHEELFQFLLRSILTFDAMNTMIENFHLHFLLKMLPYVGLSVVDGPSLVRSMELEMIEEDQQLINFISKILVSDYTDAVGGTGDLRFKALALVLKYYEHHTDQLGEIKSLKVLHQVFQ